VEKIQALSTALQMDDLLMMIKIMLTIRINTQDIILNNTLPDTMP